MARKKTNKKGGKRPPKPPATPHPEPPAQSPPEAEAPAPNFTKIPSEQQLAERAAELAQAEEGKPPRKGSKAWTENEERRIEVEHFQMSMYAAQKSVALADMGMEKFDDAYSEALTAIRDSGADVRFKFSEGEYETVQDGFYQIYARMNPETLARWGGIFAFIGLVGVAIGKVSLALACNKVTQKIEEAREKEKKEQGGAPPEPQPAPAPVGVMEEGSA